MAYNILVLDIDGTVTNSKKEVTEKTRQMLLDIQKAGKIVVLASGRPLAGIMPVAKVLQLEKYGGYILSFNGAKVVKCDTQEIIYQQTLPQQYLPMLYKEASHYKTGIITYEQDCVICGNGMDSYIEKEAAINQIPVKEVEDFCSYVKFDVNKCLMTQEPEYLAKVEKKLAKKYGKELSIYRSEPYFLEIMPQHIDKAFSLGQLLKAVNLTREEMIAVGDGFNDQSMIEYAGLGVAMSNAQPCVKEVADYVTASNDEDGVAQIIELFMKEALQKEA